MAELEADADAVANQNWRNCQIVSGIVSKTVVGRWWGLAGMGSWRIRSWSLVGIGNWKIRDCLSLSHCRKSWERYCPELACGHIGDNDGYSEDGCDDDDDGDGDGD